MSSRSRRGARQAKTYEGVTEMSSKSGPTSTWQGGPSNSTPSQWRPMGSGGSVTPNSETTPKGAGTPMTQSLPQGQAGGSSVSPIVTNPQGVKPVG